MLQRRSKYYQSHNNRSHFSTESRKIFETNSLISLRFDATIKRALNRKFEAE